MDCQPSDLHVKGGVSGYDIKKEPKTIHLNSHHLTKDSFTHPNNEERCSVDRFSHPTMEQNSQDDFRHSTSYKNDQG
jgi:hypothetical protein